MRVGVSQKEILNHSQNKVKCTTGKMVLFDDPSKL